MSQGSFTFSARGRSVAHALCLYPPSKYDVRSARNMAAPLKAAHELQSRTRTDDVLLNEGVEFSSLLLSKPVLEGLSSSGFQRPSPIQLKAIPLGRCGLDLIVQAKSGTGKTCVFTTIALDSLILENTTTQVLVLAPTREIAVQIHAVVMAIGSAMEGLECHVFIGGRPIIQDKQHLKKCHIAIGSPGRIKQLIEMGALMTSSIRMFVLDEADKLLEEDSSSSFQEQINWIFSSLPANKQMLALSATYPESLAQQLSRYMREPTFVRLNPTDPGLLELSIWLISCLPKVYLLSASRLPRFGNKLVCNVGGLSQDQRLEAMWKLKQYQCRVLISTDLTSRGIDAEKVNLVINLDVPQDWETYMHRIGRAGRFGTLGVAVTYCCHGEEENKMMAIAQKCSLNLKHLPDPIPPGIMEEACDYDVIIETSSNLQYKKPNWEKGEKRKAKSEHMTPKPSRESHLSMIRTESMIGDKPCHEGESKKKYSAKPRRQKESPSAANLQRDSTVAQQEQNDTLPKIPPLSSFKSRRGKYMTFDEALEDYEGFIMEGPGRSVEIIRQYDGFNRSQDAMDRGCKSHDKDEACKSSMSEESSSQVPPLLEVSELSSELITGSTSGSASSSESEMEVETQSSSSIPSRSSHQALASNIHHHHLESKESSAKETQHASRIQPVLRKPQPPHSPSQKFKPASKSCQKSGSAVPKRKTGEMYEEEGVDGHDYWSSYRAWAEYYNSYYHHSPYNWMRAYYMNSVYINEMMKP
ncbi:hypothetical protein DNTS_013066 [Danionella cerebrum]|uniref:RNA helicase n=1 Tax=Danionella cerebrum TaxID=2873325 RepID=A0A553RFE6_9TELE|nr:hypothetical protein DNTS_013066 [Danionella translucida]